MKWIWAKIKQFGESLFKSINNEPGGASARKLTALFSVLMGAYITKYKIPEEYQLHALYAWQILALLCLGIITFQQIVELKNGKSNADTKGNSAEN